MEKTNRELLIKDLCSRLPYGVILNVDNGKYREDKKLWPGLFNSDNLWNAKPYLRPISSMSEEEKFSYHKTQWEYQADYCAPEYFDGLESYDWLNAHHFDHRGLIPMGLALEAPEGMYKTE